MNEQHYHVARTLRQPRMQGLWDDDIWREIMPLSLDCFRPEGTDHHPRTRCKLLYDEQNLFGIFRVDDQYVRSVHKEFQGDVWKDSCVEIFIQPANSPGYFNFEFNCGGALLASYVTDPTRINGRLRAFTPLTTADDRKILRYASLPVMVDPEMETALTWFLEFAIPLSVLKRYSGSLEEIGGRVWLANFYKCGNETSHPHWASWQPLAERNFHNPESFGKLIFVRF